MRAGPDNLDGLLLSGVLLIAFGLIRLLAHWVRTAPTTPDPWGNEVETTLSDQVTPPVCLRCSTPQEPGAWFCPHCGTAVGPYNNLMPFVNVFSEGEVFRSGVLDRVRTGPLTLAGYVLLSFNYLVLAPVYLFLVMRHLLRRPAPEPSPSPEAVSNS